MPNDKLLTPDQIDTYLRDGILVVDNLLSLEELEDAHVGLANTLMALDVNVHDLEGTGIHLVDASSTNGAGGVLDIFYPEWKMKIATNETLFKMTCQLWKEAYFHSDEQFEEELIEDNATNEKTDGIPFRWHPFGAFDCNKGYMYVDRIGYRIPSKLAERIGKDLKSKESAQATIHRSVSSATAPTKKKSKARPIQRCLTPHFDCCPEEYNNTTNKTKWRPIQCFVSLTDNLEPNTGGFEAVPGFHREFHSWVQNGRQSNGHSLQESDNEQQLSHSLPSTHPQLCVGEYTHLSPSHDRDIMQRVQHIPVKAGSVVFWDNRIPHGNAYRNDLCAGDNNAIEDSGDVHPANALGQSGARAVVYCSFLPDVLVNRTFVQQQLEAWKNQQPPRVGDRWIRQDDVKECGSVCEIRTVRGNDVDRTQAQAQEQNLSELGKRLIGLQEWL